MGFAISAPLSAALHRLLHSPPPAHSCACLLLLRTLAYTLPLFLLLSFLGLGVTGQDDSGSFGTIIDVFLVCRFYSYYYFLYLNRNKEELERLKFTKNSLNSPVQK
jgi:hypothetical protein